MKHGQIFITIFITKMITDLQTYQIAQQHTLIIILFGVSNEHYVGTSIKNIVELMLCEFILVILLNT